MSQEAPAPMAQGESEAPSAWLFKNGNALFFDEDGEQIVELQRLRLCGLHRFIERYPDAPVYWANWEPPAAYRVEKESLPWLLYCIREEPAQRNDDHGNTRVPRDL